MIAVKYADLGQDRWFLVLKRGESIIDLIQVFCKDNNISAGYVSVIGAVRDVELGFYHLPQKKYDLNHISEDLEITTATGNVALVDGLPFLHLHGTFSDSRMKTYGGHVKKATVAGTVEVYLTKFNTEFIRMQDEDTGLKLMKFEHE